MVKGWQHSVYKCHGACIATRSVRIGAGGITQDWVPVTAELFGQCVPLPDHVILLEE